MYELLSRFCSFYDDTPASFTYTLSLHDALPICLELQERWRVGSELSGFLVEQELEHLVGAEVRHEDEAVRPVRVYRMRDRKSTRLNSSHRCISYAVFCLKKKTSRIRTRLTNRRQ